MAERRPAINLISAVANMGRVRPEDEHTAAAEIAVDVLGFVEDACDASGADPAVTAHHVILDLAAALLAFNGTRSIDELVSWLRQEAPARACELTKALAVEASLADVPPCSCLTTPVSASRH